MLDPFSAISLACAIVQFVDFGSKIIDTGHEAYRNSNGTTQEYADLEELTTSLYKFQDKFANTGSPNDAATRSADQRSLDELARKCSYVAGDILILLEDLKVKETGSLRTWDSLRQACRSVRKRERIQELQRSLEKISAQINSRLLYMIREDTSAISLHLHDLHKTCDRLGVDLHNDLNDARAALQAELEKQSKAIKSMNASSTMNHIRLQQSPVDASKAYCASLQTVSARLHQFEDEAGKVNASQHILRSLLFDEIGAREEQIHDAYDHTFQWIFDDKRSPFRNWLGSSDEVFWVNGKAGSGKSTLMKFLVNHRDTQKILRSWAGSEHLVCASYFFWGGGTVAQRSQLGLMKSLLYQILRQCPHLIHAASVRKWTEYTTSPNFRCTTWSRPEVSSAIRDIMSQGRLQARFCFFIDGLDEYADQDAGDHYQLIRDLDELARSPQVKLCVSSRPWTVFSDRYERNHDLYFVLQDLTSGDMYKYVKGMLADDDRFRDLIIREPQALDLVSKIRDKAEGVFLWVFLVVRSLLKGLSEHDDTLELERRLAEIPPSLEAYFRKIFEDIEAVYRQQAMRAFRLATICIPLPLWIFSHISQELSNPEYAIEADLVPMDESKLKVMDEKARASVNKWCRDLLEVEPTGRPTKLKVAWSNAKKVRRNPPDTQQIYSDHFDTHVQFLHRTVRDFLLAREMQAYMLESSTSRTSLQRAMCSFYLARVKAPEKDPYTFSRGDANVVEGHITQLLYWAKQCELVEGDSVWATLDDLERTTQKLRPQINSTGAQIDRPREVVSWPSHWGPAMDLAIGYDLCLYVGRQLNRQPASTSLADDLLALALRYQWTDSKGTDVIRLLLKKGADANRVIASANSGLTLWEEFLDQFERSGREMQYKCAEALIEHGADPDTVVVLRRWTHAKNRKSYVVHLSVRACLVNNHQRFAVHEHEHLRRVDDLLMNARARSAETQPKPIQAVPKPSDTSEESQMLKKLKKSLLSRLRKNL